jgi:hypothetical protein
MAEPHKFSLDEQETTFTIDATDRSLVRVYSNDSVFIARLEKVGAKVHRDPGDGGMFYDLPANQLSLRNPSKPMSDERRAEAAARLAKIRAAVLKK